MRTAPARTPCLNLSHGAYTGRMSGPGLAAVERLADRVGNVELTSVRDECGDLLRAERLGERCERPVVALTLGPAHLDADQVELLGARAEQKRGPLRLACVQSQLGRRLERVRDQLAVVQSLAERQCLVQELQCVGSLTEAEPDSRQVVQRDGEAVEVSERALLRDGALAVLGGGLVLASELRDRREVSERDRC